MSRVCVHVSGTVHCNQGQPNLHAPTSSYIDMQHSGSAARLTLVDSQCDNVPDSGGEAVSGEGELEGAWVRIHVAHTGAAGIGHNIPVSKVPVVSHITIFGCVESGGEN